MTNLFALPPNFKTAKTLVSNRFTEAPCDDFKFGGNLSYFTLHLTDNLTMFTSYFTPSLIAELNINVEYIF